MAENESLDLGSSYAKRWDAAFTAIQNGDPCEKVASKVRKALYGGVRKALNSLQKQCGVCPACVLRRQAMAVAGIAEAEETYKYDFLGSLDGVSRIPSKKLLHLKAFLMQVASLKDVCAGAPLPRAIARHLASTEVLADGDSRETVIALLARYRDEWMDIALDGNRKGFTWARLLAVPRAEKRGVTHASA